MDDILTYLKNKQTALSQEIDQLQRERTEVRRRLTKATQLLRALEAVLQAELEARGITSAEQTPPLPVTSEIRDMPLRDAIWEMVSAEGDDGIHIDTIFEKLNEAGFPFQSRDPKQSIRMTIYHEIRRRGRYEKMDPRHTFRARRTAQGDVQGQLVLAKED